MRSWVTFRRFAAAMLILLIIPKPAPAGDPNDPEPPRLKPVRIETTVNVRDSGAAGNGIHDDTAAIQKALDGAKPEVIIPPGAYVISATLKVHSQTRIKAAPTSVIRLADHAGRDFDTYLLSNANPQEGNSNIVVEGGIWDGNNEHNPRGKEYQQSSYSGVVINFCNVRNLTFRKLTVRNPESFSIRLGHVTDFAVENIVFDQARARPNQDGVHVGGFCERGTIRNLSVSSTSGTNDDMVALNADDDLRRHFNRDMECGPIRDIRIEHLAAARAYTFVRLLSHENAIENVLIDGVRGGFRTNAINLDRWRFPPGGGKIRNVTIRNVQVRKTENNAHPYVPIESAVERLLIENFQRQAADDAAAPTLVIDNGRPNRLEIRGLSRQQADNLLNQLPQPKRGIQFTPKPAGGAQSDLEATADGKIILGDGGFSELKLSTNTK
jgi:polygalacturonase